MAQNVIELTRVFSFMICVVELRVAKLKSSAIDSGITSECHCYRSKELSAGWLVAVTVPGGLGSHRYGDIITITPGTFLNVDRIKCYLDPLEEQSYYRHHKLKVLLK